MIRDIRPTDNPEVVVAYGQLFDLEKVLGTAERLVEHFVHQMRQTGLGQEAEVSFDGPGEWEPLTEASYMRIRTGYTLTASAKEGYEAGSMAYVIRVGPFRIRLGLLGYDGVFRKEGEYITIDGAPGEDFDPAPKIFITSRYHPAGLLEKDDGEVAKAVIAPFLKDGLRLAGPQPSDGSAPPMIFLRFSHEAFGAGEGELRIDCTDTE